MEALSVQRSPNIMLDLVDDYLDACSRDPDLLLKAPLFFRPVPIVTPPEMVPDVPHTVSGNPFAAFTEVKLDPFERIKLREAVNSAAKATSSLINDNNSVPPGTVRIVVPEGLAGNCRDCKKQFLAPLLSKSQRAKLELGEPFRCKGCAAVAFAKHEAKTGKSASSGRID
jgi:hypothetical protein